MTSTNTVVGATDSGTGLSQAFCDLAMHVLQECEGLRAPNYMPRSDVLRRGVFGLGATKAQSELLKVVVEYLKRQGAMGFDRKTREWWVCSERRTTLKAELQPA